MLITDMPGVFADRTAELNAANKKCENEKNAQNAETNFTNPWRNYCTARKRLCDHPPKSKDQTQIRQFPTLCVRNCVSSNRTSSCRNSYNSGKNVQNVRHLNSTMV